MIFSDKSKMLTITKENERIVLFLVFSVFAIIFCLISLVNHYQLRTYALDMGMYNQAVYSYSHFKNAFFTLGIDGREVPFLGTHFSLITLLYSPLYYLLGSYALLFIQIAAILFGGLAIYKYAKEHFEDDSAIPIVIVIQFFGIWGIYSALSFDYHDNVLGAMLVPWFIYFLEKRRLISSAVFLILILFTKEVMAIWMLFIILGLMIKNRNRKGYRYIRFEIPAAAFCLAYGVMIIGIIMPQIQGSENNLQFIRYSLLGNSTGEAFTSILQKPQLLLTLLFGNTLNDPAYNWIKTEFHTVLILSGGFCLLLRPAYLVMIIPLYALKFLSNDYAMWGINYQYSIEFVPIISLALVDFITVTKHYRTGILLIITLMTFAVNIKTMEGRKSKWYNPANTQFYRKIHYEHDLNLKSIYSAMKMIDKDAVVSASSNLAPHLAERDSLYHFPVVKNAGYIVLLTKDVATYPLSAEEYKTRYLEYVQSGKYYTLYSKNELLILKKKD